MRFLILAFGLIGVILCSSARAGFVTEGALALAARSSSNYNTPFDPPFEFGPTFTLLPPGSLPASLDQRGSGNFADSALKFALDSSVPTGQSIVSATLTLHVMLSLKTNNGRDPALAVSGFSADQNSISLADFSLHSIPLGGSTVLGTAGSNPSNPLPTLSFDVTSFLQSLEAAGAVAAGFQLDNLIGGTIVIAGNDATNPINRPSLTIVYAATTPEPASLVMATSGLAIALAVARRWR